MQNRTSLHTKIGSKSNYNLLKLASNNTCRQKSNKQVDSGYFNQNNNTCNTNQNTPNYKNYKTNNNSGKHINLKLQNLSNIEQNSFNNYFNSSRLVGIKKEKKKLISEEDFFNN